MDPNDTGPAPGTRSDARHTWRLTILLVAATLGATCQASTSPGPPPGTKLAVGTWGGDNAGLIVNDTLAHVHVGCTFGDFPAPITLDDNGRFSISGSYMLRAYPIAVGPTVPAQLAGVIDGNRLTLSIAVDDTVQHKLVALGPVTVVYGREPRMGPCPICKVLGDRTRVMSSAAHGPLLKDAQSPHHPVASRSREAFIRR